MADPTGPYELDRFPDLTAWAEPYGFPGELCAKVRVWFESLKVDPRRSGAPYSQGDNLWGAAVPGGYFLDEEVGLLQVMCDYRIHEGERRVEFVEMGTILQRGLA